MGTGQTKAKSTQNMLVDIQMRVNTDERVVLKGGYRRMEKTTLQSKSLCQKQIRYTDK